MNKNIMLWKDYCPYCRYFDNNTGACSELNCNIFSNHDDFSDMCSGEFFKAKKNKKKEFRKNMKVKHEEFNTTNTDNTKPDIDEISLKYCQKCKKKKENVKDYSFYAGKTLSHDVKSVGFRKIKETTSYKILPDPIKASICDDCISSQISKYWLISVGIILMLLTLLFFELIALFFLLLIITIGLTASYTSKKNDIGDNLAIGVYSDELYKKGFDSFFIRSKYFEINPEKALADSFNSAFDKGVEMFNKHLYNKN